MDQFKWNEQDVRDILQGLNKHVHADAIEKHIQEFKASKQPKPEWEILKGSHEWIGVHDWEIGEDPDEWDCISKKCSIHSVKRLSDGEVFTVGDEVKDFILGGYAKVTGFQISEDKMIILSGPTGAELKNAKLMRQEAIPVLLTRAQIEKLYRILNTL